MAEAYTVLKDFELEEIGNNEWRLKTFIGFDTPECIEIPAEIDGKKIVEIGEALFKNAKAKNVKIAEGIKSIGKSAFEESHVNHIEFPKSLKRIKNSAFYRCVGLRNVTFPESLEFIGDSAFAYCASMNQTVTFPKSIREIGKDAFLSSEPVSRFVFLEGCKAVLKNDFWDGEYFGYKYTVYIPSSVEVVHLPFCETLFCHAGSSAMTHARKKGIKCADYDKAMVELKQQEEKALAQKKQQEEFERFKKLPLSERDTIFEGDFPKDIENIVIPAHVRVIEKDAFRSSNKLKSITFEEGSQLEIVKEGAFADREMEMEKICIPKSVKKIEKDAFHAGVMLEKEMRVQIHFEEGSLLEEIGESAFEHLSQSKYKSTYTAPFYELNLPKHIRKIGKDAFRSNDGIVEVNMSACTKLRVLPKGMFAYCSNLRQVMLPPNLEILGNDDNDPYGHWGAFDCTKIISLTLPSSCRKVGGHVFSIVASMKRLIVPESCEVDKTVEEDGCKIIRQKGSTASSAKQEAPKGGFMSKLKIFFGQLKD